MGPDPWTRDGPGLGPGPRAPGPWVQAHGTGPLGPGPCLRHIYWEGIGVGIGGDWKVVWLILAYFGLFQDLFRLIWAYFDLFQPISAYLEAYLVEENN